MADATPRLLTLPEGRITLSDRRTRSSWTVEVAPFQLAPVPVTQALYTAVTGERPSTSHGDRLPVESVSWEDAVRFCATLSAQQGLAPSTAYRLPTEAEWEYACRAGTTGPRYGDLDEIAWYRGNSGDRVHPVGGRRPNAWGLHDMLGNVWEWCQDLYDPEVYGDYRVLRGGGWFDEHWSCRAGVRRRSMPTFRIDDVGFRLARSMPR